MCARTDHATRRLAVRSRIPFKDEEMMIVEEKMEVTLWTFEAVQERLVEAMRLWWRSPGEGRWPFASDAPWHLMTRKTRVSIGIDGGLKGRELQLHLQAEDAEETRRWQGRERPGPLGREDVARRDETTEWLGYVAEDNRKVVVAVLTQLAAGRSSIDWRRVKAAIACDQLSGIGNKGVYRRYHRSILAIAQRLNRSEG
jgi:hypothetical protein